MFTSEKPFLTIDNFCDKFSNVFVVKKGQNTAINFVIKLKRCLAKFTIIFERFHCVGLCVSVLHKSAKSATFRTELQAERASCQALKSSLGLICSIKTNLFNSARKRNFKKQDLGIWGQFWCKMISVQFLKFKDLSCPKPRK